MQKLIGMLVANDIIQKQDEEIYLFGLECLLLKIWNLTSFLIIAILMGRPGEFLIFSIIYSFLRNNAGGFHAKTRLHCYILSCLQVVITLMTAGRICEAGGLLSILIYGSLLAFHLASQVLIWRLAPIDNANKPLDEDECRYYRKRVRIYLMVLDLFLVLSAILQWNMVWVMICLSCIEEAVMLLLQNRRNKNRFLEI